MAFRSLWMNMDNRKVFRLLICHRTIYEATEENLNQKLDIMSLVGSVIVPISGDIMRRMFVVYIDMNNEVTLAPIRDHYFDFIKENKSLFDRPIDIRSFYDMLDI